jgi:hypothetical protein
MADFLTNTLVQGDSTAWGTTLNGLISDLQGKAFNKEGTTTQTVTAVTSFSTAPLITKPEIYDTSKDHKYKFEVSELTADRTVTLPLLTGNDTFVFRDFTQTLTNKTLTSPVLNTEVTGTAVATLATANTLVKRGSSGEIYIKSLYGNFSDDLLIQTPDGNDGYGVNLKDLLLLGGSKTAYYGNGGKVKLQGGQSRDASNIPYGYEAIVLQELGGNVGIGTSTPTEELEVVGNIKNSALAGSGTRVVTADPTGVLGATDSVQIKDRRYGREYTGLVAASSTTNIDLTGFQGEGSGGFDATPRFYYVTALSSGNGHVVGGVALYTNRYDGLAVYLATLGTYSTAGGSINFTTNGTSPRVQVTNTTGNEAGYFISYVSLN